MTSCFVTGSGKGIGRALVELLSENNTVYGISRSNDFSHSNYSNIPLDLSSEENLKSFSFPNVKSDKVILINNAGRLGEIKHVGNLSSEDIINSYLLNSVAPAILTNQFIKQFKDKDLLVLNIGSGASKNPYDGWSIYCSSKSALEMLSMVVEKEQKENPRFRIFYISPGATDTGMQEQIRNTPEESFSQTERFRNLHSNKELKTPREIASQILKVIKNPEQFIELVVHLKNMN